MDRKHSLERGSILLLFVFTLILFLTFASLALDGGLYMAHWQGLTELMLTLPVLIIVIAGMIDVAPLIFNLFVGKQMPARGGSNGQ